MIAATSVILAAVIGAQSVPSHIRELEKLASAAGAIDAHPDTHKLLDAAIREAIPEPRIRSIWPEVIRVAALASGGSAIGLLVLALIKTIQGLRWEGVYPDLIIAAVLLVLMPLLIRARDGVIAVLGKMHQRGSEWRRSLTAIPGSATGEAKAASPGQRSDQQT
ncbi:hypothetical protein OVA14_08615 [Agrococcus sp. SL85]|uniref:hypothetical protein n=1 Tax=Agrococcus sp. SL85 TaxID=2995141 RepID=UPI00226C8D89|nr:hypothetical protein [Agrococcus sp. SL85]WAC65430.1 hypothetical protein OVA14_08615 [Agrococcus sp. SL85]